MIPFFPQLSRLSTICFESRAHEEGVYGFDDSNSAIKVSSYYERFQSIALPSLTSLEHVSLIFGACVPWVQILNVFKAWHMKTVELRFTEDLGDDEDIENLHDGIVEGPFKMRRFTLDVPATFRADQWTSLLNVCAPFFPNLRELHFRSSRPYPKREVSSFLVRTVLLFHLRH